MQTKSNDAYKAWVERLVHTCLPFELEKKIAYGQPLTSDEMAKFRNVVHLVSEMRRANDHGEAMARLDDIEAEVKRQGLLTRREFRKLGDERERFDRRSAAQRTCIDKAVHLYILMHDINGAKAASFLSCCKRYWQEAAEHFTDLKQYKNFANYDYNNFYDIAALTDMINSGKITV